MSFMLIPKEVNSYINTDVFINPLCIPLYDKSDINSNQLCYQEISMLISQKLDILMKVPHQEFWCHIVYDQSILRSLQSFCNNAKRPYEIALEEVGFQTLDKDLHKKFYLLILRIFTNKENDIPEYFHSNYGDLIYDNFIVDIPLLFDLCSLYGGENPEILNKILMLIFSCQSRYLIDFKSYALQTMKFFEESIVSVIPSAKENTQFHILKNKQLNEEGTNNLLKSIIDIAYSWHIMLNAMKFKNEIFTDLFNIGFHKSLEELFEKVIPFMQSRIDRFETSNLNKMKKLLSVSCHYLISVWRDIFNENFIRKIYDNSGKTLAISSEENFSLIRDCISLISSCQEHPIFADAMYLMFPVNDDIELVFQAVIRDKDEYYSSFVNDSINDILRDINSRETIFSCKNNESYSLIEHREKKSQLENGTNINLSLALDIFPDLKENEINAYLKVYNCTAENMVEAILAGAIDTNFVKKTALQMNDEVLNEKDVSILSNHCNIYDGDDFDKSRVTATQLHLGKRQTKLSAAIDPDLRKMIMGIVVRQEEEQEAVMDEYLSFKGNLTYDDEQDDVYGISHDGVVLDDKTAEFSLKENDIPNKAYRIPNFKEGQIKNINKNTKSTLIPVTDKDGCAHTIMEPSKPRFSNYDKRQRDKKRFHEGTGGNDKGYVSNRLGSHAPKENLKKNSVRKPYE